MPDKKCPRCGLWNAGSAVRCDCGFDFEKGAVEKSHNKLGIRQSPPTLLRTLLYGIGAGLILPMSIFAPQLFNSSPSPDDIGDFIVFGIFIICFLLITIMFFFKEIHSSARVETPETRSQKQDKILLFILLAMSGVGILSIWATIVFFRPDAGQGAIALVVCIPIDCIYVATALGILARLIFRRVAKA